jgi:hypothetical protein
MAGAVLQPATCAALDRAARTRRGSVCWTVSSVSWSGPSIRKWTAWGVELVGVGFHQPGQAKAPSPTARGPRPGRPVQRPGPLVPSSGPPS